MWKSFLNLVRGVPMQSSDFRRVTLLAAAWMRSRLKPGESAVDATAGTGEDTCLLAECVGDSGKVYAFDIQETAIQQTKEKLKERQLAEPVRLFCQGHETMGEISEIAEDRKIAGIMFNLGYLPGGDKGVATDPKTTLKAVKTAVTLLAPKGIMTLCLYRHPGGDDESVQTEAFCASLGKGYNVHKIETINKNNPPYLIVVEKTE